MPDKNIFILIPIIILGSIYYAVWWLRADRRSSAMRQYAKKHGFNYMESASWDWLVKPMYADTDERNCKELGQAEFDRRIKLREAMDFGDERSLFFRKGVMDGFGNVLYRPHGQDRMAVFDYVYQVPATNRGVVSDYSHTVVRFVTTQGEFPHFVVRPEEIFHKFLQLFGYQDIDLDYSSEFSERYLLRGPDEKAIREFFNPPIADIIVRHDGLSIYAGSNEFIVFRGGSLTSPSEMDVLIGDATEVYDKMLERLKSSSLDY